MRIRYYDLKYEFPSSDENYENFTANMRMNDTRKKAKNFNFLIRTLDLECSLLGLHLRYLFSQSNSKPVRDQIEQKHHRAGSKITFD